MAALFVRCENMQFVVKYVYGKHNLPVKEVEQK